MNHILKLFSLKFISTLLGLISSIITIRFYGAERVVDVFFAAQSLVFMVKSLSQTGQLSEFFLPIYHNLKRVSLNLPFLALNVIINRVSVFLLIGFVLVAICSPWIIEMLVPGYSEEEQRLALMIFLILLPTILLQLLCSFFLTILNAEKKFGRPEVLSIINTLLNIAIILVFYNDLKIWALVLANVTFTCITFFSYYYEIYKMGFRYKFIFSVSSFNHSEFFAVMKTTSYYALSTQVFSFAITSSVSFLPVGSFAIYNYTKGLSGRAYGLLIQPVITVFFTSFSLEDSNLKTSSHDIIKKYSKLLNVIVVLLVTGCMFFGEKLLTIMWESKDFNTSDIKIASFLFLLNVFSVYFSANGALMRKINVKEGKSKLLYIYMSFSQLLSAFCSYVAIYSFGLKGLYVVIIFNSIITAFVANWLLYRTSIYFVNLFSSKLWSDIIIYIAIFFILCCFSGTTELSIFSKGVLYLCFNGYNFYTLFKLIKNENY
jgi:putative peptidoglycan lipid II flippase